eukprot:7260438-Prorocentrum_lima.AAC.1
MAITIAFTYGHKILAVGGSAQNWNASPTPFDPDAMRVRLWSVEAFDALRCMGWNAKTIVS